MSNEASLLRETEEALQTGQEAHRQAQQVLDTLRSAKGWGVYDLLGGGMISGLIKHSRMDKAQQQLEDFCRALERFNREMKDVRRFGRTVRLLARCRSGGGRVHQRLDGTEQDQRRQGTSGTHR